MEKITMLKDENSPEIHFGRIVVFSDFPKLTLYCLGDENHKIEFDHIYGFDDNEEFFDKYNGKQFNIPTSKSTSPFN